MQTAPVLSGCHSGIISPGRVQSRGHSWEDRTTLPLRLCSTALQKGCTVSSLWLEGKSWQTQLGQSSGLLSALLHHWASKRLGGQTGRRWPGSLSAPLIPSCPGRYALSSLAGNQVLSQMVEVRPLCLWQGPGKEKHWGQEDTAQTEPVHAWGSNPARCEWAMPLVPGPQAKVSTGGLKSGKPGSIVSPLPQE